ncbi:MAG: hypothetical protein Crog3KO_20940 [Crocinitomicaceae bacterium]
MNEQHAYHVERPEEIQLVDFIATLDSSYSNADLVEATFDEIGFLKLSLIDENGEMDAFYIDPRTGEKLGKVVQPSPLFDFNRQLHRSLFLGSVGRLTMGIIAAILFLMVVTGIVLIFKRQLKAVKFFGRVTKDSLLSYLHIQLGRWTFPLLLVISITGTYLSLDRFGFLPKEHKIRHTLDFESLADSPEIHKNDFPIFLQTNLSDVQKIQFPFTPFPEDYYQLRLKDRDIIVNQYTGAVESTEYLGEAKAWKGWIFNWHTGKGSISWSLFLLFGSVSIAFFIVSGFSITFKRWRSKSNNEVSKAEARIVILVGSESGQTAAFAKHISGLLRRKKQLVFVEEMNNFGHYPRIEQLLLLTSTYGNGEAPSNARNFIELLRENQPSKEFEFAVLGFGSRNYLSFCKYAEDVREALLRNPVANECIPFTKIDKQSNVQKCQWLEDYAQYSGISIHQKDKTVRHNYSTFRVGSITKASVATHQHFRLELMCSNVSYQSGDLLAILPENSDEERFYSIGKTKKGSISLSIRKQEHGICSSYLSSLNTNETIQARIQSNTDFHFPNDSNKVLLIANGTGIAPFIGMIEENSGKTQIDLLWGMKSEAISNLYLPQLDEMMHAGKLNRKTFVYSASKTEPKRYVQDVLDSQQHTILELLKSNGVIMICGSIAMRDSVFTKINEILLANSGPSLKEYLNKGKILTDCY